MVCDWLAVVKWAVWMENQLLRVTVIYPTQYSPSHVIDLSVTLHLVVYFGSLSPHPQILSGDFGCLATFWLGTFTMLLAPLGVLFIIKTLEDEQ